MTRLASKPLPIQVLGYEYDGELSVRGIRMAGPLEINQRLFASTDASEPEPDQRSLDHVDTPTNAWLTAQLDLYGIRYSHSSSRDEYIKLLCEEACKPDVSVEPICQERLA